MLTSLIQWWSVSHTSWNLKEQFSYWSCPSYTQNEACAVRFTKFHVFPRFGCILLKEWKLRCFLSFLLGTFFKCSWIQDPGQNMHQIMLEQMRKMFVKVFFSAPRSHIFDCGFTKDFSDTQNSNFLTKLVKIESSFKDLLRSCWKNHENVRFHGILGFWTGLIIFITK